MQGQNEEEITQNEITRVSWRYLTLFIVKCLLGAVLLILGGVAVKNTQGQTGTFGPPYFVGAFIVGCAIILASFMDLSIFQICIKNETGTLHKISQYGCVEVLFTVICILGGFIGLFFVCIYGVPECDPSDFFSHCNYTKNLPTNRRLAIGILIALIVSEILSIGSIVIHCRSFKGLAPYNTLKARHQRLAPHQNVYGAGGAGTVVMTTNPGPRPFAGGFGANRNYDSYSADTQVIIDGNVIDKNRGGFSGAIIHPPQNDTVVHPPVGYTPYPSAPNQNPQYSYQGQSSTSGESVNNLQEQNRLLREQIALQQQQLQLMQQQQEQGATSSSLPPPPPSYESCMQDPDQMKFLQAQNEELQNRYQSQQQQITEEIPFSSKTSPSAPPL